MDVDAEVTEEVMRNIPDSHVEQIYRQEYWNRVAGDKLPRVSTGPCSTGL